MIELGVAHLTALELPPAELAREAARAGFRSIGLRVHPATVGGPCYPTQVGSRAQRELADLLASEGVRLNEIEFISLTPDVVPRAFLPMLEAGADLGATSVTVSGDDPDGIRLAARFADLCDLARPFGLRVDLEFMRWRAVGTLAQAETVLRRAGKSNSAILLDALHLHRSGGKPADLAPLSASALRAAQLCDAGANIPQTEAEVIAEAREGRLPPGEGVLPLAELLEALPGDVNLSVEMPFPGLEVRSRLARAFDATRRVLAIRSQGTADRARESAPFPTRSPSGPRET